MYDSIIAGGELIDPGSGVVGRYDLGIAAGQIAAVAPRLDAALAAQVIDAQGLIVTPGLVDLHTHIYWGATYWGVEADPLAARTGVTTWLDAGSAGAYNFPGFRRYVSEASRARIFGLLNLSSIGLVGPTWEFTNPDYCDTAIAATIIEGNRDLILGIKARIDRNTTRGVGIWPLERARELADAVALPLMVHIGNGPPAFEEIVPLLRPGDILTHCFTGGNHRIIGPGGLVRDELRVLRELGVILDIGHGTGSFSYEVAEAALAQGVVPDVISSDIHQLSVQGPMFDLPTTMSKFLNLGMSLPDLIERCTTRPAAAMGRPDLGTLKPGSRADIALFRLEQGSHSFHDTEMLPRSGTQLLVNTLTLVDGLPLPRLPESPPAAWAILPPHQLRNS